MLNFFKFYFEVFYVRLVSLFLKKYTASVCGHTTKSYGVVKNNFGETYILRLNLIGDPCPEYCLNCLDAMSVPCAYCEKPIHVGEPITLHPIDPEGSTPLSGKAKIYLKGKDPCAIGCLGVHCCSTIADTEGYWIPPGMVKKVPSVYERFFIDDGKGEIKISENVQI